MSASYDEDGCHEEVVEELFSANDDEARSLFESGGMCNGPGRRHPVAGDGEYAQRLRAVIGRSEAEYSRALEWQEQREFPDRYIRKLRRLPRAIASSSKERLIGPTQFCDAYSAVAFANSRGAVLNTHVTLSWPLLGYEEDADASAALQLKVIKHMREWYSHKADRLAVPFVWMYSHERSATFGLHTHLLVFIPYAWRAEFKAWFRRRVAQLSRRRPMPKEALHIVSARADRQLMHQWRLFGYLMKSVDPQATLPVYPGSTSTVPLPDLIPWEHEGPGEVTCKLRVGWAHEIGASARARANDYLSLLECGVTDVRLLYGDFDFKVWQWAEQEESARKLAECPDSDPLRALSAPDVEGERALADAEFQLRYEEWLQMAKGRDEALQRTASARPPPAIMKLFDCKAAVAAGDLRGVVALAGRGSQ